MINGILTRRKGIISLLFIILFFMSTILIYFSIKNQNLAFWLSDPWKLDFTQKLEIRHKLIPNVLFSSLEPFKISNDSAIYSWPLTRYPDLPYNQTISCLPRKFGYTDEQANLLFDPNRKFIKCGSMQKPFMKFIYNKLNIICKQPNNPEYIIGDSPDSELLGELEYNMRWRNYWGPIDIDDSEFAFSRCSRARVHAILTNKFKNSASKRALNLTQNLSKKFNIKNPRPLTHLIILFDSLSRQHFYRNFPELITFFNKTVINGTYSEKFVLYDFLINNAHGENTAPNMVPLLYGYNIKYQQERLDGFSIKNEKEWWKFREVQNDILWKFYEDLGYVTMFGYDTIWDFMTVYTGREILTDHRVVNFWRAAKKVYGYMDFMERQRCFGIHNSHWYLLNYANEYLENYSRHNRFGYIHLSTAHEGSGTVIKTADVDLQEFFERLLYFYNKKEEDVIIHLMSDHGKHSREWDMRYEGYLENQLPLHIILANKNLINRLDADEILKHNTKRLVSRLDWSLTFRHLALSPYGKLDKNSDLYKYLKMASDTPNAVSLFMEKIDDKRECDDVDISNHFCTCIEFLEIDLKKNKDILNSVAELGVKSINQRIINEKSWDYCQSVSLNNILSAEMKNLKDISSGGNRIYKIWISINEDPYVTFEVYAYSATLPGIKKHMKIDYNNIYPISNHTLIENEINIEMILQLHEIVRVDAQSQKCNDIIKMANLTDSICVCKDINNQQEGVTEDFSIFISEKNNSCDEICKENNYNCELGIFKNLNKPAMLKEKWKNIQIDQKLKDFVLEDFDFYEQEYGLLLGIKTESVNKTLVFSESLNFSCNLKSDDIYPICPCA